MDTAWPAIAVTVVNVFISDIKWNHFIDQYIVFLICGCYQIWRRRPSILPPSAGQEPRPAPPPVCMHCQSETLQCNTLMLKEDIIACIE